MKSVDPIEILRAEATAIRSAEIAIASHAFRRFCLALSKLRAAGNKLVVTGVGKSAIVARKISATMATVCIPSVFIDAVGLYHGELGAIVGGDMALMVSHSGNTEELVRLIDPVSAMGGHIYSLVSERQSALGALENTIVTGITREAYLMVPTSSSAASVAVGDAAAITAAQMCGHDERHLSVVHPGGEIGRKLTGSRRSKESDRSEPR